MEQGLILTSRDKYYRQRMEEKERNRPSPMKWRQLQHPTRLMQFELLSLRNLDRICLLDTVRLEILYLHLDAELLFSPRSSLANLSIEPLA